MKIRLPKSLFAAPVKLLAALIGLTIPVHASLIINTIFDSSITGDPNAVAIENAINSAVQYYENSITNSITVSIYFQEGGGLGESNDLIYTAPYTGYYEGLVANDANPAAIAGLNANGGDALTNGGFNPLGGPNIEIKAANARAVGFLVAPGCIVTATGKGDLNGNVPNICALNGTGTAVDGIISLNTSITNPPNTPASSFYGLVSTAEHEMDEVLGLGSALANCNPTDTMDSLACQAGGAITAANDTFASTGTTEDLFRYSAPTGGVRTLSTNCQNPTSAYFEYGPSTGEIAQFNNACNDGDFGDWKSNPLPQGVAPEVQDAFGSPGAEPTLGPAEIDALTAIGFNFNNAVPEPGSMFLLGAGLTALGLFRRRRV